MGGGGWGVAQTLRWMAKFEYGVEMAWDGVVGVDWNFIHGVGLGVAWEWDLRLVMGWHMGWCLGWLPDKGGGDG